MRPEEGKDGASRAPCAAFVSSTSPHPRRVLSLGEDAMQREFEISGGGSVYLFKHLVARSVR